MPLLHVSFLFSFECQSWAHLLNTFDKFTNVKIVFLIKGWFRGHTVEESHLIIDKIDIVEYNYKFVTTTQFNITLLPIMSRP